MKRFGILFLVLTLAVLMILPACAKKEAPPVEEDITPAEEVPPPPPPPVVEEELEVIEEELESLVLEDVFFDFDKYSIKSEFKGVLDANAELLMLHSEAILVIEGHCDERGTAEYNLALGEKRAKAVIDYYLAYGVDADRLSMISYGEERPFEHGHDENAWTMNRRSHMVIKE